jgi:hypothetical protein
MSWRQPIYQQSGQTTSKFSSSPSPSYSQLEIPIHWTAIDRRGKDLGAKDLTFWNGHDILR